MNQISKIILHYNMGIFSAFIAAAISLFCCGKCLTQCRDDYEYPESLIIFNANEIEYPWYDSDEDDQPPKYEDI